MSAPTVSDPIGGQLYGGRYALSRKIARGGMATVYEGVDNRLDRVVAVKLMHEGLGDDVDFAEKFDKEARAAAKLSHPNIVAVFDQGVEADRPYIVMEYVQGCTLRAVMRRDGAMTPGKALAYIEPVVRALAAAHDVGLVHCDVKPENVLISDKAVVKVTDFGLAKAVTGQTNTATQGMLIGTVSYISPERVTTNRATSRSDVYSAGVVLFELLTGVKPHTGDSPIQVAYSHVHNDIDPPSAVAKQAIPDYLDALVVACTRRDPAERPVDGRALAHRVALARQAVAQGKANDAALAARLGAGPEADAGDYSFESPATPRTARSARSASTPTTAVTATLPALTPGAQPTRTWTLRSPKPALRARAATPISPVDFENTLDGEPFDVSAIPPPPPARPLVRVSQAKVHRRRRGLVALVLLMALALLGAGGAYYYFAEGRWTTTPDLVGMTEQQARATTEAALLGYSTVQEYSEDVPAGKVIRVDPVSGARILKDGGVTVTISRGPERFDSPAVVGKTREEAAAALTALNLVVGTVTEAFDETVPPGVVVGASVEPGSKLKRGTAVDLVVSKGPKPIAISSYVGKNTQTAQQELQAAGFVVTVTLENSKTVPEGQVISQTPAEGQGKKGDTITLVGSKGPVMVVVPTVRGLTKDQAVSALQKEGFATATKTIVSGSTAFGLAYGTDPAAGTKAPQGSTVTILVG